MAISETRLPLEEIQCVHSMHEATFLCIQGHHNASILLSRNQLLITYNRNIEKSTNHRPLNEIQLAKEVLENYQCFKMHK